MEAVRRIARYRGIHEETSTGTTDDISTAMPRGSHQSTARIPPLRAAGIPQIRKLDCPLFMGRAQLFAYFDYSPHLIIEQGFCHFASYCVLRHRANDMRTPDFQDDLRRCGEES